MCNKTLTLKQVFWKAKISFKKLEYRFIVESIKIESAIIPYKTTLSKATVKTNRTGNTKWTYHKERSFTTNYFIFLKNEMEYKNPEADLGLLQHPRWSALW